MPLLLDAMKPITTMVPERYPVHQAILFALARLGTKDCKECIEKLDKQIERDEKAVRLPGARDLLGETRVTAAIILNKGAGDAAAPDGSARAGRGSGPGPRRQGRQEGQAGQAGQGRARKSRSNRRRPERKGDGWKTGRRTGWKRGSKTTLIKRHRALRGGNGRGRQLEWLGGPTGFASGVWCC